jgi:hypothetical protein
MSELDRIVNVRISKETSTLSQKSFGVPLIVFEADDATWDDEWDSVLSESQSKTFTSTSEILEAFPKGSAGKSIADVDFYKAAQAILAQNPKVSKFQVGRIAKGGNSADLTEDLNGFAQKDSDFYFIVPAFGILESEALPGGRYRALPQFADETERILFCAPKNNANLFANAANSLAKLWAGFTKCVVMVMQEGEWNWAAWVGEGAPFDPGSSTWAYKRLATITPTKATSGDFSNITRDGNWANIYHTVYGQNITEQGKCTSGEWIDVEIGIDWLKVRLQEAVYTDLIQSRKIPYDDVGIQIIHSTIAKILQKGAENGIIQGDTIEISTPLFADIPKADVGRRHLPDIKFSAAVLNAIHTTTIDGRVTL